MGNKFANIMETLWYIDQASPNWENDELKDNILEFIDLIPFIQFGITSEVNEAANQIEERLSLISEMQIAMQDLCSSKANWDIL